MKKAPFLLLMPVVFAVAWYGYTNRIKWVSGFARTPASTKKGSLAIHPSHTERTTTTIAPTHKDPPSRAANNIENIREPGSELATMLDAGQSLNAAIEKAILRAPQGKNDATIASVVQQAAGICNEDPDTFNVADPRNPDASRTWAITRKLDLCSGFEVKKYRLKPPPGSNAAGLLVTDGPDVAAATAFEDVAHASDRQSLYQAGQVLFETHQFPLAEVSPEATQLGLIDLNQAWLMAVDLAMCSQWTGCGPNSLRAAEFCSFAGCPPGSDLEQAYKFNLSPDRYQMVLAFAQWIATQRW